MSIKYVPRKLQALPGEVPMKQFCIEQAALHGVRPHSIYTRLYRGNYPGIVIRRVNSRIAFVRTTA